MKTMRKTLWHHALAMLTVCVWLATSANASPVPLFTGGTVGEESYVALGTANAIKTPNNGSVTIEGWVYFDALSAEDLLFNRNPYRGALHSWTYVFGFRDNGTKMSARGGAGWLDVTLPTALTVGQWYHVAFSFDGTTLSYYLDGALIGTQAFGYTYQTRPADRSKIGGYHDPADIRGSIADLRVWDHARSAAQIQALRRQRLTGREQGLMGYWRLDEGAGRLLGDRTVNAAPGELVGAAWTTRADFPLTTFDLSHPVTQSPRFTGSNSMDMASLQAPDGYTHYQVVEGSGPPTGAWTATNAPWAPVSFATPAGDEAVTLTAWFTNLTEQVALRSHAASLFYTTVLPVPAVRATLTRQRMPGSTVVIQPSDLDISSSGGVADGMQLALFTRTAICTDPGADLTPEAPYVTLDADGTYSLVLALQNEAGNMVTSVAVCTVSVSAYSGVNTWTGGGASDLWHDGANWTAGIPLAGQTVAMNSAVAARLTQPTAPLASLSFGASQVLTFEGWNSALVATSMVVNGTLTHLPQNVEGAETDGSWTPQHRILLQGTDLTLGTTSRLDADERGYLPRAGPGRAYLAGSYSAGGGGGYGGHGSTGRDGGVPGPAVGDPADPWHPGSGGGTGFMNAHNARPGGGAIRIEMQGRVTVDGLITARGATPVPSAYGSSGSGGGIAIHCQTFQGAATGLIRADGGRGNQYGGSGGGGRIALHYDPVEQAKLATPRPLVRFSTFAWQISHGYTYFYPVRAMMGTLFLTDTLLLADTPEGDAVLDGQRFWHTRLHFGNRPQSWSPTSLSIDNCVIGFPEGYELNVASDLTLTSEGAVSSPLTGDLEGGLHLFAANTNVRYGATLNVGRDFTIGSDTWFHPHTEGYSAAIVGVRVGRHVSVANGGGIDALGKGYMFAVGNANGHGAGTGWAVGGSYGGKGSGAPDSKMYGRADLPLDPGSPGVWTGRGRYSTSGKGGGVIHVLAGGRITINGLLTAEGGAGIYYRGGGGSGGSILLTAQRFAGNGILRAKGGQGSTDGDKGPPGGGGRIAIWHGLALSESEQRILDMNTDGLMHKDTFGGFSGSLDVSVYDNAPLAPATEGTKGFFSKLSTLIILR